MSKLNLILNPFPKLSHYLNIQVSKFHIQILVILVGIVLVLELYWNCWDGCVYCIGIGPKRSVLFNCVKNEDDLKKNEDDLNFFFFKLAVTY